LAEPGSDFFKEDVMKKVVWTFIGLAVVGFIGYRAIVAIQAKQTVASRVAEERVIPVEAGMPVMSDVVEKIFQTGAISARSEVTLYPKVSGKLAKNLVEMSDDVSPAQVVALVDRDEVGYEYKQYEVRGNVKGTVARVYLHPGAAVNPNTPLCQIVDIDIVKAIVPVPEGQIRFVSVGHSALVTSPAYPDRKFPGKVTNISPLANPVNRTIEAEISVANPRHLLKPGMFVQAELVLERRRAMLVPFSAVTEREGRKVAFVVQDSTAVMRPVTTGAAVNDSIEITSGLQLRDRIVITGTELLNDRDKIQVVGK
jgi:multidrug efflux pump subunit AcrA (membrane-fusion protein)